jgi:hypothetical protein
MINKQGSKTTRFLFGIVPLALVFLFPLPTMAEVSVNVNISLPPPIEFVEPPELIVLPETNIYVYPDMDMDIFFYDGWWWRLWEDRWYRSQDYNSDWGYYRGVPSFYREVPSDWRNNYREHRWRGHQWNYQRIPHQNVQQNWRGWEKSRYWEHQQTWGVKDLQPQTRSKQPVREVQPQQSRPHAQEIKSDQPQPQSKHEELRPQTQSRQPIREEQQRQSRPQGQEIKSGQPQQHQETGPQVRKDVIQKDVQPQGKQIQQQQGKQIQQQQGKQIQQQQEKHEGGKEENQEKR